MRVLSASMTDIAGPKGNGDSDSIDTSTIEMQEVRKGDQSDTEAKDA